MAALIVTAALVIATAPDGSHVYLYQGAQVPEGLRDGEAERFENEGLAVRAIEPEVPVVPAAVETPLPEGEPDETWKVDQIEAYAASKDIDLSTVKLKAEKLDLIASHSA